MSCNFTANFELARNVTYAIFETISEICPTTYIRPDPGGSMMPWLGSLLLLSLHLPACIIRAVKWESAQYLALGLAVLGIALTVQAFVSTKREAAEVLVWMPLTLILDVGAMLQMVILIIETHDESWQTWNKDHIGVEPPRGWKVLWNAVKKFVQEFKAFLSRKVLRRRRRGDEEAQNTIQMQPLLNPTANPTHPNSQPLVDQLDDPDSHEDQSLENRPDNVDDQPTTNDSDNAGNPTDQPLVSRSGESDNQDSQPLVNDTSNQDNQPLVNHTNNPAVQPTAQELRPENPYLGALHSAFVAFISFILFLMLLVLQGYGLYAAFRGRHVKDVKVNWCSPAFRDFAIAVTTGNCQKLEVIDSSSNGIGCISLPGDQQREWLLGTVIALIAALICQAIDAVIMLASDAKWRPRGLKARRPWLTMIGGCATLGVLIFFGVINANNLPKGVTETVWIYRKEPSREMGRVCRGKLNPPGLRGVVIGYMDGLFESWGASYYGH